MRCALHVFALLVMSAIEAGTSTAPLTAARSSKSNLVRRDSNFGQAAAAGGVAAAAATITFHPIDTIKTVLQRGGSFASLRAGGMSGLYRGVGPAAFSMMPACAVRMGSYEAFKSALLEAQPANVPPGALIFLASALSVVVSSTVRAPLDMVKVQVQAASGSSGVTASGALRAAWGGGGLGAVRRLYNGAGLGLLRDVPFFSINLLLYEQLRAAAMVRAQARALADGSRPELSASELVVIGACAQGVAGWLTNPVDVLKTRVQAGGAASVAGALRAALKDGGPAALMRGASMRVVWIAPQGCIYYPAYELTLRLLSR